MLVAKAIHALGPIDLRGVVRDPLLRWMSTFPLLLAGLLRWGVPVVARRVEQRFGLDLVAYYPLLMSGVLLTLPLIAGVVVGFLLLDERDDRTLEALQVTPLSIGGYVFYRITTPMLVSVALTMVVFPVAGLIEISWPVLLGTAIAAAPFAPLFALFLAAFADNKVQGFALMKAAGQVLWAPVLAYFVPGALQLAFGVVPVFWPAKAFWMLEAGNPAGWVYALVAMGYQLLIVRALLRRFERVLRR